MLKKQYLDDSDVAEFIDWFASEITTPKLGHGYARPDGTTLVFDGLADALQQYDWPFRFLDPANKEWAGRSFADSEKALGYLAQHLRAALQADNDQDVRDWACRVMKWGGVANGNVSWLHDNVNGLAAEIRTVETVLCNGEEGLPTLQPVRRFNSGMTKVYSLLVPDFIIYDSRVAAALAWFVNHWCEQTGRQTVPPKLAFPCMPAKEGENPRIRKLRNPSNATREFPRLNGQARVHAQWNLRASWLLETSLKHSHSVHFPTLRALEAALFMWGYDLNQPKVSDAVIENEPEQEESEVSEPIVPESDWRQNQTLGKSKPFQWVFDIEQDALIVDRGLKKPDTFNTPDLFFLLHLLYEEFGDEWFHLANNVETLKDGSERPGLGKTLYRIVPNTTYAQAASQLAPIFLHYGVFDWEKRGRSNLFRLQMTPPPSIGELHMLLAQEGR